MTEAPPPLSELQQLMQRALMFPRQDCEALTGLLESSTQLGAGERLAIYQRSYHARLQECMSRQFPALRQALGPELFVEFCGEYLRACPSRSYTLHELGARFADHLEHTRPDRELPAAKREHWIDFMVDLASFEYAMFRMFDAPGHEAEGRPYAAPELPDLRLVLQPCVFLGAYRYPVADYYHEVRGETSPALPMARASYYVLVRKHYQTRTLALTRTQHDFFAALLAGCDIAGALAQVAKASDRPLAELRAGWTGGTRDAWIEAGVFVEAA